MRLQYISNMGVKLLEIEPEPLDTMFVPRVGEHVFIPDGKGQDLQWRVVAVAHFPMVDRIDIHIEYRE